MSVLSTGEALRQDRTAGRSALHHSPTDDFSRSEPVDVFVDLVERKRLV
jgi:hypothetical protein